MIVYCDATFFPKNKIEGWTKIYELVQEHSIVQKLKLPERDAYRECIKIYKKRKDSRKRSKDMIYFLKNVRNLHDTEKAKELFYEILDQEQKNEIPKDVYEKAKTDFDKRYKEVDWNKYHNSLPFNNSALALYEWSPIAEELKTLDRKIVLNSMILKWDNIKKEFEELINF